MKKSFVALSICAALAFVGCIDRDFDLADTSGEMTIGGEELVVPLGEVDQIKLGDVLKENETLKGDENGVYQIAFSSFGDDPNKYETLTVEGISIPAIKDLSPNIDPFKFSFQEMPTSMQLAGFSHQFEVDFPTVNDVVRVRPVTLEQELDITLPDVMVGKEQGSIPETIVPFLPKLTSAYSDKTIFNASISILEELKKIDFVEFGCEDHPYGAPFYIKIDLMGLQGINGGGTFKLNVEFPKGYYLRNDDGSDFPAATHNILNREFNIEKGQQSIELLVFLHKIDYSDHDFDKGMLIIEDEIKYSYDVSLGICAGDFNLKDKPKFTISAEPQYKDVEVVINHFDIPELKHEISYSFEGLPNAVNIEKVTFTDKSNLTISLKGLEKCVINDNVTGEAFSPSVEIALPKCMRFRSNRLLDAETNRLLATTTDLSAGIELSLEHIDCTTESVQLKDGKLSINETISAALHLESLDGHTILASSINPLKGTIIDINISNAELFVDMAATKISWTEDQVFDFDLKDQVPALSQTIDIPEMISSIECIEIGKAGSKSKEPLSMSFDLKSSSNNFPVDELEVNLDIKLGKMLRPTQECLNSGLIKKDNNGDYILSIHESWFPNKNSLSKTISFEALENIPAIKNGKIKLEQTFPVAGSVKIKSGENIDLSGLEDAQIDIDIKIDDIEIRTFTGGVNIEVAPEQMVVELGNLSNIGVDIKALSINPVLRVKLKDNPTGIPFSANIAVKTFAKEGNQPLKSLKVPTIPIAGTGASEIVLSTPKNAAKYERTGVTFIAVEGLSSLLTGELPAKIAVDMSVASDSKNTYTIDLLSAAKGYTLAYQYEVIVPMEFDGDVNLSYETAIDNLNETFAFLADDAKGIMAHNVGLIAEINTTIPLNIQLSAQLVNKDGTTDGIDAALNISNNGIIHGWTEADGDKPRVSNLDLQFDLGDSQSLAALKNVDGIKLSFSLLDTDTGETVALKQDQYIGGEIKIRVRGGVTVDIKEFLMSLNEEI